MIHVHGKKMDKETIMLILGGLVFLGALYVFMGYFQIWLRSLLSGAPVEFPVLVAMKLRNTPVARIVDAYITCVTAGITIKIDELEKEYITDPENFDLYVKELVRFHRDESGREQDEAGQPDNHPEKP